MNYKNNIGYFNKGDTMKFAGFAAMIIGFALLWLGWSYVSYILATLLLPGGVVLFIVGSAGRSSDGEIDNCIRRASEGMEIDFSKDVHYAKRLRRNTTPEILQNYVYQPDLMLTRSKSNSLRSSEYSRVLLYTLTDEMFFVCRTFSLVEDKTRNTTIEIPYTAIEKIEVERTEIQLSYRKKTFTARPAFLSVTYDGGKMLRIPARDDITLDQLAEQLTRIVAEAQKKN